MRPISLLGAAALLIASIAAPAPGQGYEPWDNKLRNPHHWVLKEEDIAVGGRAAYVNGEWQGNFRFELSDCPRTGCRTFDGTVLAAGATLDNYLGVYAWPGMPCALRVTVGERDGMDDGLVLALAPTEGPRAGCRELPARITGHYESYWINHAKMAAQSQKAAAAGR